MSSPRTIALCASYDQTVRHTVSHLVRSTVHVDDELLRVNDLVTRFSE